MTQRIKISEVLYLEISSNSLDDGHELWLTDDRWESGPHRVSVDEKEVDGLCSALQEAKKLIAKNRADRLKNDQRKWIPITESLPPRHRRVLIFGQTWHGFDFMAVSSIGSGDKWELPGYKDAVVLAWSWLPATPADTRVNQWLEEVAALQNPNVLSDEARQ